MDKDEQTTKLIDIGAGVMHTCEEQAMNNTEWKSPQVETAEEFRKLRRALKLTVAQMAAALQVSPSTIESWESGIRKISKDILHIKRLANEYARTKGRAGNFLYGIIPLKAARYMVSLDIEHFSYLANVSVRSMRAYEQGVRKMPTDIRIVLERRLASFYRELQQGAG